jgi:hypothetical protein
MTPGDGVCRPKSSPAAIRVQQFPIHASYRLPPSALVLRPPFSGPPSSPSGIPAPAFQAHRIRPADACFQRRIGPNLGNGGAFSLGAEIPATPQEKSGPKISRFVAINLLTGQTASPMGCGRSGARPPPVVVSNPSITGNNFSSTQAFSTQKSPVLPLIFTLVPAAPAFPSHA